MNNDDRLVVGVLHPPSTAVGQQVGLDEYLVTRRSRRLARVFP